MDEVALVGSSSEGASKSVSFDGARRMALKHIEAFVLTFLDPHIFSVAAASSAPASLSQVAEAARIQEAGHLRCSGAEIGRFVAMLRNSSSILRACAAFALLQFTILGGRHAMHHAGLLHKASTARVLCPATTAATTPLEAKILQLQHHHAGLLHKALARRGPPSIQEPHPEGSHRVSSFLEKAAERDIYTNVLLLCEEIFPIHF